MSMRLFITGIGTDVGKTIAAAAFTEALQADYWKPVQSGNTGNVDADTVRSLITNPRTVIHPEAYSFKAPVSPHLAAKLEHQAIDIDRIVLPATSNHLVIEGAGGLLVPLNDTRYVIDLAGRFDAEVVLVIRAYVGCINHALLSLDYLLKHHYRIKGLVLNGWFEPEVKEAILRYPGIPVLAEWGEALVPDRSLISHYAKSVHL